MKKHGGFIPGIGNFSSLWPLKTENFNEDLRLTSTNDGPFSYIAGFYYQDAETAGGQDVLLPDFGFNGVNRDNKLSSKAWAIYADGSYTTMDDRLVLTVGGRFYKEKRRFDEDSLLELLTPITGLPDPVVIPTVGTDRATEDTFNPRFNIAYHPTDNGMIYAEAAKGFRSGAITSSAIIGAVNAVLGTTFENSAPPDTLWNYTAGIKWSFADNTVDVELAGYLYQWDDAQLVFSPALQSSVVPVGDVEGKGIDLTLAWATPIEGLSFQFTGNINDTELDNVDPLVTGAFDYIADGERLPGTAKNTFALRGSYETPLGASGLSLRANALWTHRSKVRSLFDGRFAPNIDRVNAQLGVGTDRWEVALYATNLTDEIGPLARPGGQEAIPFPRTFGLSLELSL